MTVITERHVLFDQEDFDNITVQSHWSGDEFCNLEIKRARSDDSIWIYVKDWPRLVREVNAMIKLERSK